MAKNNAKIVDIDSLIAAGLDPNTGLPLKMAGSLGANLEKQYKALFEEVDRQEFVNKGTWYNLPGDLDGALIEKILYYRGQGAFFYEESLDRFYFLPYSLEGNIDIYGRYKSITPVAFGGVNEDKVWIPGLVKNVVNDITKITDDDYENGCVILHDRSVGLSQKIADRHSLNEPILASMAEVMPFCRTNLIANSGVKGMRVNSEPDAANVKMASRAVTDAAKTGNPWIPITSTVEFQDLTDGGTIQTDEYLEYFQALDNLRRKVHGLESGGVMEKKAQMLQDEMAMNSGIASRILDDTTKQRQDFCVACNIVWGLDMWYEPGENTVMADVDGDGVATSVANSNGPASGNQEQKQEGEE